MEKGNKRDLESLVVSQKEQLTRYETRLKDVVAAYKGLFKEKEALEASLAALTSVKDKSNISEEKPSDNPTATDAEDSSNLQLQIATLMNSLATLSAEKSRMEASFQADKKQIRSELLQKDKTISELQENIKDLNKKHSVDLEAMRSKIIIERHEREKESNNHMVMIRELQKLYADERHLKENLEMQLNDLKTQFSSTDNSSSKYKELTTELKETKERLKQFENKKDHVVNDNSKILQQLQNEMQHLKQQHAVAIKTEQRRAHTAEERSKKLAALHEDRVANLEARLAELSTTVGTYDRLRQQDQENIQKLKDKIIQLASGDQDFDAKEKTRKDVPAIVDEIMQLKKLLIIENARCNNPVDINKIFNTGADHNQCIEDINKMQAELNAARSENTDLKQTVEVQKNHIKTLQEKVKVLNRNIDEQDVELKSQSERLNQTLRAEKDKWKDVVNSLENECRFKLNEMEQQLQKQRVRSLQLLDEKENEIKALKTSFEIFVPNQIPESADEDNERKKKKVGSSTCPSCSATVAAAMGENCHMLHYANELARKEVEISNLRKAKHSAETALRQALQDKVTAQEDLNDQIMNLEEQVDRLERCKTREGANLEYLKNVILSYLSSKDADGKKHMVNAISAVLQFTPGEMKMINNLVHKK